MTSTSWLHDRADRADRATALGHAVRLRRGELGLTQEDLADLAGCSERFVHTLEAGKTTVRLDKMLDVLAVLGLALRLARGRGGAIKVSDDLQPTAGGQVGHA